MRYGWIGCIVMVWVVATLTLLAGPSLAKEPVLKLADNATAATQPKVVLPPEVEALFPEGECDAGTWNFLTRRIDYTKHTERRVYPDDYPSEPACKELRLNNNLYGGTYYLGVQVAPPHPDHPHRELFEPVAKWERINPIKYVHVLRKRFIDISLYDMSMGKAPDKLYAWNKFGPCYKRLLMNNEIIMERGLVDLVYDGEPELVYRYTYPSLYRKRADGEFDHLWHYYIYNIYHITNKFNNFMAYSGNDHTPVKYKGKIYWISVSGTIYLNGFSKNLIVNRRNWLSVGICRN